MYKPVSALDQKVAAAAANVGMPFFNARVDILAKTNRSAYYIKPAVLTVPAGTTRISFDHTSLDSYTASIPTVGGIFEKYIDRGYVGADPTSKDVIQNMKWYEEEHDMTGQTSLADLYGKNKNNIPYYYLAWYQVYLYRIALLNTCTLDSIKKNTCSAKNTIKVPAFSPFGFAPRRGGKSRRRRSSRRASRRASRRSSRRASRKN